MGYNLLIAVGGMLALVSLWVALQFAVERVRAVQGDMDEDCDSNSVRCLGCYAAGKCKSKR